MHTPPRLLERLLARIIDARDREWIVGDMAEEYGRISGKRGRSFANRWYLRQLLGALGPSGRRRLDRAVLKKESAFMSDVPRSGILARGLDALRLDLRIALRHVARTPLFAAGSVATLGLGLGVAVAIFSVVNGVLLRPLPYREPDKLVWIWSNLEDIGVPRANTNGPQVVMLREQARQFEGFAILDPGRAPATGPGGENPEQLDVTEATANLFDLLGVRAAVGRTFLPGEDGLSGEDVAVLSWALWQTRYGGDPGVIGQNILLFGEPHEIIGVMPRDFRFVTHTSLGSPERVDLWITLRRDLAGGPTGSFWGSTLGRVASNATMESAILEAQSIAARMGSEWGWTSADDPPFQFRIVGLVPDLVGGVRSMLIILQVAVLLLLVCVVAGQAALLVARADQRTREVTIARALGAGAGALMRPVIAESVLLALLGGALGVTTAAISLPHFLALVPQNLPRRGDIALDWTVLYVTVGATILVGICAGIFPALRSARRDLITTLREVGVAAGRRAGHRLRTGLVVGQIALSFVLVTGSALLARSMRNLLAIDPGFATTGALTFEVQLPGSRYESSAAVIAFAERARGRLSAIPGVISVGATSALPLGASADQGPAQFPGSTLAQRDPESAELLVDYLSAAPGYFAAMGIDLIEGRDFVSSDGTGAQSVAIIDRTLAERHFPDGNALGQQFRMPDDSTVRVVGVVEHARLYRVDEDGRSQVWAAFGQLPRRRHFFALRTSSVRVSATDVRRGIADIDPLLPVNNIRPVEALIGDALSERRLAFMLVAAFGFVAILLAVLGSYTLIAATVSQRSREIGIRMAIGARQADVARMVVASASWLVLAGIAVGVPLTLAGSRALRGQLYGIAPTDAGTYALTALVLAFAALLSAVLPARRAARIQPARTLREE